MAAVQGARVVRRGIDSFSDQGCVNQWRWQWAEVKVEQCEGGAIERIGHNIRKIDAGGCARCNLCSGQILVYGSRGLVALKEHIKSANLFVHLIDVLYFSSRLTFLDYDKNIILKTYLLLPTTKDKV